jgi:hypothetical protein
LTLGDQQHRIKLSGTGAAHQLGIGGIKLWQHLD